ADIDQVTDSDLAFERAIDIRIFSLDFAAKPAALVDVHGLGGQLPLDLSVNLYPPAIADLAPDESILRDDQYAFVTSHFPSPSNAVREVAPNRSECVSRPLSVCHHYFTSASASRKRG